MLRSNSVTIKDIAKKLGISTSTVSRALTNHSDVNPKTKEAVLELAQQLDYQPNSIALSLRKKQTHVIGVIIPETVNRFFSKAIGGIQDEASKAGYNIMVCQSNESQHIEFNNIQTLLNSFVDGIIISVSKETSSEKPFQRIMDKGVPLVFFDRVVDTLETPKVMSDNYEAAFKATSHLVEMGCSRIARISGPLNLYNSRWRLKGYQDALLHHNLEVNEELVIYSSYAASNVREYTNHLLDLPEPPDGIFAINDQGALEMMHTIKQKGLRIPEDICVIGFNNDYFSAFTEPSLSSVEIPAYELGRIAAELLLKEVQLDNPVYEKRIVPSKLVLRDSTRRIKG